MNKLLFTLIALFTFTGLSSQDITTVDASNPDISDNLDLEAVASIFGDSKDLEDFENRLNDPESRISNLDLNQDGYVDYLRVIETAIDNAHLVTIQAVLDEDLYQDVATIDVERDSGNTTRVQVVGDVYMYGSNYIIEPVYVTRPIIYSWFWGARWNAWVSPWSYGYYPTYWRRWNTYSYANYYTHIHAHHIHVNNVYYYTSVRRSNHCLRMQRKYRRADYHRKSPGTSFASRHKDISNKRKLDQNRGIKSNTKLLKKGSAPATGKEVRKDWQANASSKGNTRVANDRKVTPTKGSTKSRFDTPRSSTKQGSDQRTASTNPQRTGKKSASYQSKKVSGENSRKPQSTTNASRKEYKSPQPRSNQRSQTKPTQKSQTRSSQSTQKRDNRSYGSSSSRSTKSNASSSSRSKSGSKNSSATKSSSSSTKSNSGKRR